MLNQIYLSWNPVLMGIAGLVIEEITEVESLSSENHWGQSLDRQATQLEERSGQGEQQTTESECLQALKDDPDRIRQVTPTPSPSFLFYFSSVFWRGCTPQGLAGTSLRAFYFNYLRYWAVSFKSPLAGVNC